MNSKKILCYVALVILTILIILPPTLRIFVKDDNSIETPKDVIELLTCTKNDESINMPYKNGALTMIKYSFKEKANPDILDFDNYINDGDNSNNYHEDAYGDKTNNAETIKSVLEKNTNTQKDNDNGEVTYKLEINESNSTQVPETYRGTSEVMKSYYTNLGYSCNIIK